MRTLVLLMLCCVAASLAQSPRLRLINFLRERNINRGINNKFYNALEEFFTEELTGGNPGGEDGGDDGGSDQFGLGDGNGGSDNGGNGGNEGNTNNCPLCAGAPCCSPRYCSGYAGLVTYCV